MKWWRALFGRSRAYGPPFLRWYPQPANPRPDGETDIRHWRVVEEDTRRVVASNMSREDAIEVARDHNAKDPVRSWADWWEQRNVKPT